jgi:alginate O-acetyltransferase complex protein AlgI
VICAIAATPIAKTKWNFLRGSKGEYLMPLVTAAGLIACTAFIVDASYNPFLYFRF